MIVEPVWSELDDYEVAVEARKGNEAAVAEWRRRYPEEVGADADGR